MRRDREPDLTSLIAVAWGCRVTPRGLRCGRCREGVSSVSALLSVNGRLHCGACSGSGRADWGWPSTMRHETHGLTLESDRGLVYIGDALRLGGALYPTPGLAPANVCPLREMASAAAVARQQRVDPVAVCVVLIADGVVVNVGGQQTRLLRNAPRLDLELRWKSALSLDDVRGAVGPGPLRVMSGAAEWIEGGREALDRACEILRLAADASAVAPTPSELRVRGGVIPL